MREDNECFTDNSQFNRCVACKNCVFRAKTYADGRPIPEEKRYVCGFCQIYNIKPTEIALYEGECKYKAEG